MKKKKVKEAGIVCMFNGRQYRVIDKAHTLAQWREYIGELIELFGEDATLDLDSGSHLNVQLLVEKKQ